MPPTPPGPNLTWSFLLDNSVDFRSKHALLAAGTPAVLQLPDVGLSRYSTDPDIFQEVQQRRLVFVTKDTDFITQLRYVLGHDGRGLLKKERTPHMRQDEGDTVSKMPCSP